jgi:hypothetical protein
MWWEGKNGRIVFYFAERVADLLDRAYAVGPVNGIQAADVNAGSNRSGVMVQASETRHSSGLYREMLPQLVAVVLRRHEPYSAGFSQGALNGCELTAADLPKVRRDLVDLRFKIRYTVACLFAGRTMTFPGQLR